MGRISELIDKVAAQSFDRYHTPGHKGALCKGDITELGIGGEIFPAQAVELAQNDTAELYGVKKVRYLTGGSSMGIKAALYAFRGRKVMYARGVHRAFSEACELWDVKAEPIGGEKERGLVYTCGCADLPEPLTLGEAERALCAHKDAAALFITSPDYLGRTADIEIADLCREKGVALIVDSAHGAHFAFAPGLEQFRFERKADSCNMSAHKTLGAYTQSALLALGGDKLIESADHALELLGTTSPNYPMLARLEDSVREAAAQGKEYLRLKRFAEKAREHADCLANSDYTRLCVRGRGGDGRAAFEFFARQNIMAEAAIGEYAVFILTPYDSGEKLDRLLSAVQKLYE